MEDTVEIVDYYDLWNRFLRDRTKQACSEVRSKRTNTLYIDVDNIPHRLFLQLLDEYDKAVSYISEIVVKEKLCEPKYIRFIGFPRKLNIRELRSDQVGQFVTIDGIARSISSINPLVIDGKFECSYCGNRVSLKQTGLQIEYPDSCTCRHGKWVLLTDQSKLNDIQMIKLQERPDDMRGGETPAEISCYMVGDICGLVNAGNHVSVSGMLRPMAGKQNSLIVKTMFEINNIVINEHDYDDIIITDSDEQEIIQFAKSENARSLLAGSITPSIYGYENIKLAALLQMFGGVRHKNKDGTYKRGDTHILIFGDPGVAKSQMLEGIYQLCPRGIKASGKGSSKAGLTAAAIQDATGGWTIEAGAIVLSDKGHLIVDEIDKMRDEDRSALHEGMEQQQISIAKAGINMTLMCRCSVLAAANPTTGRFDATLDIAEQINLPPTLLSRFDLIFLMKDLPDKETDSHIADFILGGYDEGETLSPEFIRKYIAYAKTHYFPVLTPVAKSVLKQYYLNIRELASRNKPIPITPRQLDALRRLGEAAARMRLSDKVTEEDANLVVEIVDSCLKHVAYDPETGQMDIDRIMSKMSSEKRSLMRDLRAMIRELTREQGKCEHTNLLDCMVSQGYDEDKIEVAIQSALREGMLYSPSRNVLKEV